MTGILLKPATITTRSGNPVVSVVITWILIQVYITWLLVQVNHLDTHSGIYHLAARTGKAPGYSFMYITWLLAQVCQAGSNVGL